jgi:flagellar assembly protein FliH
MAVIVKRDSGSSDDPASSGSRGLAGFNLSDLADEGRQQIEECRQQAAQIIADANRQADQLRRSAEQRGYQQGLERGSIDAEAKIQETAEQRARTGLDLVRSAVDQMYEAHEQWMCQYAESVGEIAIAATSRILRTQLDRQPQLIVGWAEDAVRSVRSACELTVAVHPETLAQLGQALDEMLSSPDLPENTRVVPDESVGPTEVAVRQSGGEIQAGLEAQLRRLEELFT